MNVNPEDFFIFLSEISEILTEINCCICKQKSDSSVRLRSCEHVFCTDCMEKCEPGICPLCKLSYKEDELQDNYLSEMKTFIEDVNLILDPELEEDESETILFYRNLNYCLQYVQDLKVKKNKNGEVPLHLACKSKSEEKVRKLLDSGHNLNEKDYAGWTPLHEAVISESIFCCRLLLEYGAIVNTPGPDYVTPLHKAVEIGNIPIIKLLLKYGSSVDAIDFDGRKPRDYTNNEDVLDCLLNYSERLIIPKTIYLPSKMIVYTHSIDESYKKIIKKNKNATVVDNFTPNKINFTHIIIKKSHKLSSKILVGIVCGLIFLNQEDIPNLSFYTMYKKLIWNDYLENNALLNEAIQKSTMNNFLNGPKLFDGCSFFLMHRKEIKIYTITVNETFLKYLIELGDGKIIHRMPNIDVNDNNFKYPYHTDKTSSLAVCSEYVIYNEKNAPLLQYKVRNLRHMSSKWLIDCVLKFCITE